MKHEERKKIAKKFEEFAEKYSEYSGGGTTTLSTETISTEVDAGSTMSIPMYTWQPNIYDAFTRRERRILKGLDFLKDK